MGSLWWKETRREEAGFGLGKAVNWDRRAMTNYAHVRMGKGNLGDWRRRVGAEAGWGCRRCGSQEESGDHVAFGCVGSAVGRENLEPEVAGVWTRAEEWFRGGLDVGFCCLLCLRCICFSRLGAFFFHVVSALACICKK